MGQEIETSQFRPADFTAFTTKLRQETQLLKTWFQDEAFTKKDLTVGFELETWLVDAQYNPAPINEAFLAKIDDPLVGPELSRFNIELNSTPLRMEGHFLENLKEEL